MQPTQAASVRFNFDGDTYFSYEPSMTIDELNQESPSLVLDIGKCITFYSPEGERRWIEMNETTTLGELFDGFIEGLMPVFYKYREYD